MPAASTQPSDRGISRRQCDHDRTALGGIKRLCPGTTAVVVAITAGAAALRFATLDVQSVWLDEALTMHLVGRSFSGMLSHLSTSESTPPLYYVLAWVWTRIFGAGIFAFRCLSAFVGSLTVPLVYVAGRRYSPATGWWALVLVAISPLMFYYSQEIRDYALLFLLATSAFIAWQRALEAPTRRALALWSALSMLAVLTHYFAAFMFAAEAVVLVRRHGVRQAASAVVAVGLVCVALVPLAVAQRSAGVTSWIAHNSLLGRFAQTGKDFLIGPYGPWGFVLAPLAALLVTGALIRLRHFDDAQRRRALRDVGAVGLIAVTVPALLAATGIVDVFDSRNVLAAWMPWTIFIAAGLASSRSGRLGTLLGAGLCAISALVIAGTELLPSYQRDDWRDAAHTLPAALRGGRAVVAGPFGAIPLSIYLPQLTRLPTTTPSVSIREVDFVFLRSPHGGPWRPGEDAVSSPVAPAAPSTPPGFRLASAQRTAAYATYRFLAPVATTVEVSVLRRAMRDPTADVALEH